MMTVHDTRTDLLDKVVPKGARVAELGVFKGEFSEQILKRCQPSELHLVDLWEGRQSSGDKDGANAQHADMAEELARMTELYADNSAVVIHQTSTLKFMESLEDNSLDAIYIDADHAYVNVRREIEEAARVVAPGGWIMGHDLEFKPVRLAVFEFCEDTGHAISHAALDRCPSYAIQVNEAPSRGVVIKGDPGLSWEGRNSSHLKNVMDELEALGVDSFLVYGSALFAARDNVVSHNWDSDMDIGVWTGSLTPDVVSKLRKRFRLPGGQRRGDFARLHVAPGRGDRHAQEVDIFSYGRHDGFVYDWLQGRLYHKVDEKLFGDTTATVKVRNDEFRAPNDLEGYLEAVYGNSWREVKKHTPWRQRHRCVVQFTPEEVKSVREAFNIK